jgi:putrescine aminotransferase
MSDLISLEEALRITRAENLGHHRRHLNDGMSRLAELIGFDEPVVRAQGPFFWDADGNRYLDFLGGFGALSLGHNPPEVCAAVERVASWPNLVEGLSTLEGALAHNLAALAPGSLSRVFLANSGAEVVDSAIKLARAATGRVKLIACEKGFHGRTLGALSVTERREYREPFRPLLEDVVFIPFGDDAALQAALAPRDAAGFIVEPIQGEAGIVVPPAGYLARARALCAAHGTLMIADEVQTGLGRTGGLFAVEAEGVVPDVLLLGKALGGGVMPLSALLTTEELYRAARCDGARSPLQTSTYGGNTRACAAGIATLQAIRDRGLVERAASSGAYLLGRLRELQRRQPLIASVRGRGLMIGIEWAPATRGLATVGTAGGLNRLSREYLAGLVVSRLLQEHRIMTAFTLNDQNVLRLQPPLDVELEHVDHVVEKMEQTLLDIGSFVRGAAGSLPRLIRAYRASAS